MGLRVGVRVIARGECRGAAAPRALARCARLSLVVAIAVVCAAGCASWRAAGLYQRGTQALERGDSERAVGLLAEAAQLAPEASDVRNHLGLAQLAVGREDLALESFELATQLDCDNAAARENLERLQGHQMREAAIASVSSPRAAISHHPEGRNEGSEDRRGRGEGASNREVP